jgi:MinD superfamily P-loop ATPase
MRQIAVVSGKGGTGKTSITAAFVQLAAPPVVSVDADVDASNLALLLAGVDEPWREFSASRVSRIDPARCNLCRRCLDACRFGALSVADGTFVVRDIACEGCGVCAVVCRQEAVSFVARPSGRWTVRATRRGPMVHATLAVGGGTSGKLVATLRDTARGIAQHVGAAWLLIDGPPGIGCPVHAAITGVDLLLAVTEPTPSALHDLARVLDLARRFRLPAAVILNKSDLDPATTERVAAAAALRGAVVLGRVPFDPAVPRALAAGESPLAVPGVGQALAEAWGLVERHVDQLAEVRGGRADAVV